MGMKPVIALMMLAGLLASQSSSAASLRTMNQEQRKEAQKLSKLSGKEFDQEYVKYEVKDHREDIKDQKEQIRKTADPELKQFASKELETVTGHEQKVNSLEAQIK
jgi:putative membrane protein